MRLIGAAERGMQVMVQRAVSRKVFGKMIAQHGSFQSDLAKVLELSKPSTCNWVWGGTYYLQVFKIEISFDLTLHKIFACLLICCSVPNRARKDEIVGVGSR